MEFAANFVFYAIKAVLFGVLTYAGIILGKKYRDKKDLNQSK